MNRIQGFCGAEPVSVLHPYSIILLWAVPAKVQTWRVRLLRNCLIYLVYSIVLIPVFFGLGSKFWLGLGSEGEVFQTLNCLYDFRSLYKLMCRFATVSSISTPFPRYPSLFDAPTIFLPLAVASLTTFLLTFEGGHFPITVLWYCLTIPSLYRLFPPSGELCILHLYFAVGTHL